MPQRSKSIRLLVFNYTLNSSHSALSHQSEVVNKLTKHFENIYIVTNETLELPNQNNGPRIRSLKWKPHQNFRNLYHLFLETCRAILQFRPTHVFYHMVDTNCALLSPIFRILGTNQTLWYAHRKKSIQLVISSFFIDSLVTSTRDSFPILRGRAMKKLHIVGQGIDLAIFSQIWKSRDKMHRAICVGRLDPSKGIAEIVSVLGSYSNKNAKLELSLVGESSNSESAKYVRNIKDEAQSIYPHLNISLLGSVRRESIPNLLATHDFFIHAYQGSLDKVLVEATLVGIPVISSNLEFQRLFGTWSSKQKATLREEFHHFAELSSIAIATKCRNREKISRTDHNLNSWVTRIAKVIEGC